MSKLLRNSLIIILIIPIVIWLSFVGILPTPLTDVALYSELFFLIILVIMGLVLLGLYEAFCGYMASTKRLKKYRDPDPSLYQRVVKDGIDGVDYLVSGSQKETFGESCRNHWQFAKTDKHSFWIIKDERGNDITNTSLESYDGIAIIVGTFSTEYFTGESESDIPSECTSIEDGTEYYD